MTGNDDLRTLFDAREPADTADACPTADGLWAAATLEATVEERRRVVDHLGVCPHCAEAWKVDRRLAGVEHRIREGRTRKGAEPRADDVPAGPPWWRAPLRAAAVVVVAAGLGLVGVELSRRAIPPAGDDETVRGAAEGRLVEVAPEGGAVGFLSAGLPVLAWRWEPGRGIASTEPRFAVSVMVRSGEAVLAIDSLGDLSERSLDLRSLDAVSRVLANLSPGDEVIWTVAVRVDHQIEATRTFVSRWRSEDRDAPETTP